MSQEIDDHIDELGRQLASKNEEFFLLEERAGHLDDSTYTPEAINELKTIKQNLETLGEEIAELSSEIHSYIELKSKLYSRPSGGLHGIVNGLLPDLPEQSFIVQPTKDALRQLPSMRKQAFITLTLCAAVGIVTYIVAPWTGNSLTLDAIELLENKGIPLGFAISIVILVMGIVYFLHIRHRSRSAPVWDVYETKPSDRHYMERTLRFRLGSEQWSVPVRIWTAVVYGVYSAILLPVFVIVSFAMFGYLLTRAYVKFYEESGGSSDTAALMTTKLHGTTTNVMFAALGVGGVLYFLFSVLF